MKYGKGYCASVVLFYVFVLNLNASAADWPVFHGKDGKNHSPETGLLSHWPEGGPKLLWKKDNLGKSSKPTGYASASVFEGRIFITGNVDQVGGSKKSTATLYCLDEKTGQEIWKAAIGDGWMGPHEGERGTPTIDDDRVYVLSARGQLGCFDTKEGKPIWSRNLVDDFEVKLPEWAYAQSPIIDGNNVILGIGGKSVSIVALNKNTGKTVWETPFTEKEAETAAYATPTLFQQDGFRMVAVMSQKALLVADADTGRLLSRWPHESLYGISANMPIYLDGNLLITSNIGSQLLRVTVKDRNITLTEIWKQKNFDMNHGGVIVHDGYAYGASERYKGGVWLCMDLASGDIVWEHNRRLFGRGSCSYADGHIYCYEEREGIVALLQPSSEKFSETSRFSLPEEGQGNFWAHPVICNKRLYLRHDSFLYCYDISE